MDAGSFVIALLTAAGAAAGPAAIGALPDATAPTARCITAPDEERSGSARSDAEVLAQRRAGSDVGRDDRDTDTSSSALAEALAQELADVVADTDDPTFQRLADALAAAGFEPNAGDRQETTASRSDGNGRDDSRFDDTGRDDSRLGDSRLGDSRSDRPRLDDQLTERDGRDGNGRSGSGDDRRDRDQQSNNQRGGDRLGRSQDDERGCAGQDAHQGARANRSSDLEDVLPGDSERGRGGSGRSSAPAERGGSGIADVLERGERTTG